MVQFQPTNGIPCASLARYAVLAWLLGLAACGGGGGGGSDSESAGGGTATTNFIPASPAIGAVLEADATRLLPLRDGMAWHYRAVAGANRYGVLVRSNGAGSGTRLLRLSSAGSDDDDTVALTLVGAEIRATSSLEGLLGVGGGELTYTLLRSPVRQNEQLTLIDRPAAALNVDVDGDRINDSADLAAYSRVVGVEAVTLPDLQRTLDAVRVDTTVVLRLRRSAAGLGPIETLRQTDWYANGVGLIRSRVTTESGNVESDENLVYFDGIDTGLGLLPSRAIDRGGLPAGSRHGRMLDAARIGNGTLVASVVSRTAGPPQLWLQGLDAFGRPAAAGVATGLELPFSQEFNTAKGMPVLPLGNQAGMVLQRARAGAGAGEPVQWRLHRFDALGRSLGPADGVLVAADAVSSGYAAAAANDRWWLAWISGGGGRQTLWLRAFDFEGRSLQAPEAVASSASAFGNLTLAHRGGRLLLGWSAQQELESPRQLWVSVRRDGQQSVTQPVPGFVPDQTEPLFLAISGTRQALFWDGPLAERAFNDDRLLRGALVSDEGLLRTTAAGSLNLDNELLTSSFLDGLARNLFSFGVGSSDNGFVAFGVTSLGLVPGFDTFPSRVMEWARWDGAVPLAESSALTRRFRLGHVGMGRLPIEIGPGTQLTPIEFNSHWLLIGHDDFGTYATVVFP
jgi:hypothetical protein